MHLSHNLKISHHIASPVSKCGGSNVRPTECNRQIPAAMAGRKTKGCVVAKICQKVCVLIEQHNTTQPQYKYLHIFI